MQTLSFAFHHKLKTKQEVKFKSKPQKDRYMEWLDGTKQCIKNSVDGQVFFEIIQHRYSEDATRRKDIIMDSLQRQTFDESNRMRQVRFMVSKTIEHIKEIDRANQEHFLKTMTFIIRPEWLYFKTQALPRVHVEDIPRLHDCYFTTLYDNHIFILDKEASKEQVQIEYLGLCLLFINSEPTTLKEDVQDTGVDIIVHVNSYQRFFCLFMGIQYFESLKRNSFIIENGFLNIPQIVKPQLYSISCDEFDQIKYPTKDDFRLLFDKVKSYGWWSQVD